MDDDWGVTSQTLDARYHWNFSPNSYLEPHVRYYTQSAADFYRTVMFADDPHAGVRLGRPSPCRPRRRIPWD